MELGFSSNTYGWDLPLFESLGLKPFVIHDQRRTLVGKYKLPDCEMASVEIWVTCMPAQFWQFIIETDEGRKFEATTGSGSLSDYWPSILKIAEGMLVVRSRQI